MMDVSLAIAHFDGHRYFMVVLGSSVLFDFDGLMNHASLTTLIECLWDTFLVNKNMAISLLGAVDDHIYRENVSIEQTRTFSRNKNKKLPNRVSTWRSIYSNHRSSC
jgi:hypothetical protein